jgi:ligand-binding sensor domain-containing protein
MGKRSFEAFSGGVLGNDCMSFVSLSSRLKRYALASLSAAVALPAFAQKIDSTNPLSLANSGQALSQVKVDSWQTDQGLPINTVQALLQTRSGHLWVGTAAGLARFDGLRFTVVEAQDIPELTNKAIFGLSEDSEGALWIGSFYGAVRYKDGIYERVIVPEQTERSRVWGFAEAADGTMWASRLASQQVAKPLLRQSRRALDRDDWRRPGSDGGR